MEERARAAEKAFRSEDVVLLLSELLGVAEQTMAGRSLEPSLGRRAAGLDRLVGIVSAMVGCVRMEMQSGNRSKKERFLDSGRGKLVVVN